jgi:hypothetical protein
MPYPFTILIHFMKETEIVTGTFTILVFHLHYVTPWHVIQSMSNLHNVIELYLSEKRHCIVWEFHYISYCFLLHYFSDPKNIKPFSVDYVKMSDFKETSPIKARMVNDSREGGWHILFNKKETINSWPLTWTEL